MKKETTQYNTMEKEVKEKEVKEVKKPRVINTTVTRNIYDFSKMTGNIYESVAVLSKRANQISVDMKRELHKKIEEFAGNVDTMDEMCENREQIEVVRHFEQMPKHTLQAVEEYREDGLHSHNPAYRTMTFREDQTVRCIGRVIGKLKDSQIPTRSQMRMLEK